MLMVSQDEGIDFLKKSFKTGYNFFDTAEVYVGKTHDGKISNNEELLGLAIESFRDEIVIASKFGITIDGIIIITQSNSKINRRHSETIEY